MSSFKSSFGTISVVLLLVLSLSTFDNISAQSGISCTDAVPLKEISEKVDCDQVFTTFSSEFWATMTPDSQRVRIRLANFAPDTTHGHFHRINVYSGNCSSLVLLFSDTLSNDSVFEILSDHTGYTPGNTYYIQLLSNMLGCKTCVRNPVKFTLDFQDMSVLPAFEIFSAYGCGLDYAYDFVNLNKRFRPNTIGFPLGANQPAALSINIPPTAVILQAYVFVTLAVNAGQVCLPSFVMNLINPIGGQGSFTVNMQQNIPPSPYGFLILGSTGWNAYSATGSVVIDVTSVIPSQNFSGNYQISGLPTEITTNALTDVTGAALFVVYTDCAPGAKIGFLSLQHSINIQASTVSITETFGPVPTFSSVTGGKAFVVVGDVEQNNNSTTQTFMQINSLPASPVPMPADFFRIEEVPGIPVNPSSQNFIFTLFEGGLVRNDQSNMTVHGEFFQNASIPTCHPFITPIPDVIICEGGTINLSANAATPAAVTTYQWSPSTGLNCTTCQNVSASPASTTTYTITASSTYGCAATETVTVTVNPKPVVDFDLTDNEDCMNNTFTITNQSIGGLNYEVFWGDGTPSDVFSNFTPLTMNHVYNQPGQYAISLIVTNANGCCDEHTRLASVTPYVLAGYNDIPTCCSFNNSLYTQDTDGDYSFLVSNDASALPGLVIRDTVFITNGATVTLNGGSVYQFGPWGKVIVDRGAKLILDNATLQGLLSCGTMWQGVEVWGNESKSHNTLDLPFHGQIELRNGARILNAHNGTVLGRLYTSLNEEFCSVDVAPYDPGPFLPGYGGGLITAASGSVYIVNANNVRFAPFPYFNKSVIRDCRMIGSKLLDPGYDLVNTSYRYGPSNLYNRHYPPANILGRTTSLFDLLQVRQVSIIDNILITYAEYGTLLKNASARIIGDLSTSGNAVRDCNFGIRGLYFNSPFYGNIIKGNSFSNLTSLSLTVVNPTHIYLDAGKNDVIHDNVFGNTSILQSNNRYSIYFRNSQGFSIKDNEHFRNYSALTVINSGLVGGQIRNLDIQVGNLYFECFRPLTAVISNPFLMIRCNDFNNPNPNLYGLRNWFISGPLLDQGVYSVTPQNYEPAGNRYAQSPLRNEVFSPNNSIFLYVRHNNPQPLIPSASGVWPPANIVDNTTTFDILNSCAEPGCPCEGCCRVQRFNDLAAVLDAFRQEYANVSAGLDQGSAGMLIGAINSSMNNGELKNLLVSHSPLSDPVLAEYLSVRADAPPGLIKEVFEINLPASEEVYGMLSSLFPALPPGISSQLISIQANNPGIRTPYAIQRDINRTTGLKQNALNDVLSYYVSADSVEFAYAFLESQPETHNKFTLLASYIADGRISDADALIPTLGALSPEEQDLLAVYSLSLDKKRNNKTIYELSSTDSLLLTGIAGSGNISVAVSSAQNWLEIVYGITFSHEADTADFNLQTLRTIEDMQYTAANALLSACYYDPFTGSIHIRLSEGAAAGSIIDVFDISGRLLFSGRTDGGKNEVVIEIGALPVSVCHIRITETEGRIENHKLFLGR